MQARAVNVLARSVVLASALAGTGCRKAPPPDPGAPAASASSEQPLDRLAPGELGLGEGTLFGLPIPRGMTVNGEFKDFAIATGPVRADAVANFVKNHVSVARVELGSAGTIFPDARIHGVPGDRVFRIEVFSEGSATRLLVRDTTPPPSIPPPSPDQRPSPQELWRRAGFTPDGKPLDQKALE